MNHNIRINITSGALAGTLVMMGAAGCGYYTSSGDDDPAIADAAVDASGGDGAAVIDATVPTIDGDGDADGVADARVIADAAAPGDASVESDEFDILFAAFRASLAMAAVPRDDHIRQAAANHCYYCDQNPGDCGLRESNPGGVGYTGENFWHRMISAGFFGDPLVEVMSFFGDPARAFEAWVASVYHRAPLVSYWSSAYGYAAGNACDTGDFSRQTPSDPNLRSHWPLDGAVGIPTEMPIESPELAPGVFGYAVSVHASGAMTVTGHSLEVAATSELVPHLFVNRDTDPHSFVSPYEVFLVPHEPLLPNTEYRVSVAGVQNTAVFADVWQFTTASASD